MQGPNGGLAIHGLSVPQASADFSGLFLGAANAVAAAPGPHPSPARVRVVRAPSDATFATFARAYPIPPQTGLDLAGLALLNGMEPGTPVRAGTRLKVLVAR